MGRARANALVRVRKVHMSDIAVVIVTAAPEGHRPDGAFLTKVDGRESVMRTMELFANREGIAQTMLVIDTKQADEVKRKLGSHLMFMGIKLLQSGATWMEQLAGAKEKLPEGAKHVLVHDAARPAVPYTDIDAIFASAGKHPAVALASPVVGPVVEAKIVPGAGQASSVKLAQLLTPMLFTRAAFDQLVAAKKLPDTLQLLEGSPLNQRCGWSDPGYMKAMVNLLPKPKVKAPSSPFEEAQW